MTMPMAPQRPRPRRPIDPTNAQDQAGAFQDAATTATNAAAASAKYDYGREVGARLGGLAKIGALRSGGASAGVAEAGRTFSERVGNAAAGNALQAAGLGQREAESIRGLGFSREQLAAQTGESAADRASREKLAGADLGFRQQQLAEQQTEFGQDLGFKNRSLTSGEQQAAAERASREGMATADIGSRERIAGMDVASREKLAAAQLEFEKQGLSSEEARAAAQNQLQRDLSAADLGFREKDLSQRGTQFEEDLGFRRSSTEMQTDLEKQRLAESQREFDVQRADAAKAAAQKKKGGLFSFIGKALGFATSFIPGVGGTISKAINTVTGNKP